MVDLKSLRFLPLGIDVAHLEESIQLCAIQLKQKIKRRKKSIGESSQKAEDTWPTIEVEGSRLVQFDKEDIKAEKNKLQPRIINCRGATKK